MNGLETLLGKPVFQSLGWTLIHFIWEGAIIALIYAGVSVLLRRSTANVRYAAACIAMLTMLIAPAITIFVISRAQEPAFLGQPTATTSQPTTVSSRPETERVVTGFSGSEVEPASSNASPLKQWVLARLPRAMPWLLALWFLGVILLSIRFAGGLITAQRLRRVETSPTVQFWQEKLRVLCHRLRVSRPVRLCESALVEVPTVIGWLRPVILLPLSAASGLSAEQLEALLAHELAHIRRCDYLVNLIQTTIETLLFYHPAVWWVSRQIRHEREHCCDDLAVAACGDVLTYARALAALEQMRVVTPQLAVAASGGSLLGRIQRLLRDRAPSRSGFQNWLAGFLALATVFGLLAGAETALLSREAKAAVKDELTLTILPLASIAPEHRVDSTSPVADRNTADQPATQSADASAVDTPPDTPINLPIEAQPKNNEAPAAAAQSEAPAQEAGGQQDFISEMAAAGLTNLKIDDLTALKIHGVTPQFIREMTAAISKKPTAEELVAMKIHGVSAAYAEQFKAIGLNGDAEQLVGFAIHGVTPQFINEMKAAGVQKLDPDSLVAFRIHGVTPAFIQMMRSVIRGKLTPDDLTALSIHGVSPEYIKALEAIGYTNLNAEQLTGFRIHGVSAAFISAVKEAGYPRVTADQLIELRIHGVSPEFIQTVKSHGFTDVTIDQVVELRRLNIIPSSKKK